ncbi:MAG: cupin domain-containing protein [Halocynthiibacter sp.]
MSLPKTSLPKTSLPKFILDLPAIDVPFPDDVVSTNVVRSDQGLVVFFSFHKAMDLPPHSHKGQWGCVLEGLIELTIGDTTRTFHPGESYSIPAGVIHSARIPAGARVIDVFEEPDRYALKGAVPE